VPSVRRLLRRAVNGLRYDGVASVALKLALKLCSPIAEGGIEVLLAKDLRAPLPPRTARVPLQIRTAVAADIPWIVAELVRQGEPDPDTNVPPNEGRLRDFYLGRLNRGEKLFFATVSGELAHLNWTCFVWAEALEGLPLVLADDEVCTTDAFTTRRWRGNGIHEAVLNEMLQAAVVAGRRRAFTLIDLDNVRSLRGVRRLGWATYGVVAYARLRGTSKIFLFRLSGRLDPLLRTLPAVEVTG
jgi:hypothetical protein